MQGVLEEEKVAGEVEADEAIPQEPNKVEGTATLDETTEVDSQVAVLSGETKSRGKLWMLKGWSVEEVGTGTVKDRMIVSLLSRGALVVESTTVAAVTDEEVDATAKEFQEEAVVD